MTIENLHLFNKLWKVYKELIIKTNLKIDSSPEKFEEISFEISSKLVDSCQVLSKIKFTNIELAEVNKIVLKFLKSKNK